MVNEGKNVRILFYNNARLRVLISISSKSLIFITYHYGYQFNKYYVFLQFNRFIRWQQ